MIPFYSITSPTSDTKLWVIGKYDGIPAGNYLRRIEGDRIAIVSIDTKQTLFAAEYYNLSDALGQPYSSMAAFKEATNDFFVKPPFLEGVKDRLDTIENTTVKLTYYEEISSTTGTITPPQGATIILDQWAEGVDAILSGIPSGTGTKPDFLDTQLDATLTVDGS
jgi:hypothetical protein